MNGNQGDDVSQGDADASSREGSYFSDVSESLSVPDTHRSDNKKGKLACARRPNNQQSNDSVVDKELSKSQSSIHQKGDIGMNMKTSLRQIERGTTGLQYIVLL